MFSPYTLPASLVIGITLALAVPSGNADDWPAYRGTDGTGATAESIPSRLPPAGLGTLWKTPTATGFSSFVVAGERALTLVRENVEGVDREVCVALNAQTGAVLWKAPVGIAKYDGGGDDGKAGNNGGDGPRSTPTIVGDRVYTLSARLLLNCLELGTGKAIWTVDILASQAGRNIQWQSAASPVVDGRLVFVAGGGPGRALLALDATDGHVVWKGQDDLMTHATPVATTILGTRQIVFFTQRGLVAVQPADGRVLWRYGFPYRVSTAASPVVGGDIVYCSAGYDVGSAAVRIQRDGDGFKAVELWRLKGNRPVANHWSTPVYREGFLYGMFSFKEYGDGPLKCVELATGKVAWEQRGFGAGNVILANDRLLALTDAGELVIVAASPDAYKEVCRTEAVEGKCWSTPALSGGRVFVRSTREGACLELGGSR